MRSQKSEIKKRKNKHIMQIISVCILLSVFWSPVAFCSEKWSGVDETVVEKYAKEHGREAREPFINTDQGDMLLFVFLLAGAIGGFAAGYYWRILVGQKAGGRVQRAKTNGTIF